VARLCDYLNVSQSTLYRVFSEAEGTSPLAWFHRARMEEARTRLANGTVSVKEVAHALGYDHASDLSRAYRRYFGAPARGAARRRRSQNPR
jgi:AraC-like DNA-binding protein